MFKKIELGKEAYQEAAQKGISLTQLLEEQDPSKNYQDTKLDAFERQLAARGLVVTGPKSVRLEEFYDPNNRVLFPEFINREIQAGMVMSRIQAQVNDLIATTSEIDSGVYDAALVDMSKDFHTKIVGEGAKFPKIELTTGSKPVTLRKHGIKLMNTYEMRRRIKANVYAVYLRLIGQYLELDMVEDCIGVAINGNSGNNNAAGTPSIGTGVSYDKLVDFFFSFDPYEPTRLIGDVTGIKSILKLTEFKDPMAGFNFQATGNLIDPIGMRMRKHNSSLLTNKFLGLDNRFTVEKVLEANSYLVEADKIIDGQWDELVVSIVVGFSKIIATAAQVWDYS